MAGISLSGFVIYWCLASVATAFIIPPGTDHTLAKCFTAAFWGPPLVVYQLAKPVPAVIKFLWGAE